MQLAPLSTSLNTQISVNIYTHVRTHRHTHTHTDKRRCNFRCHSRARFTAYATNLPLTIPPSRLLPLSLAPATIRSISSNQVILIHYAYAGNTWETCTATTTATPTMATQCRVGPRPLTPEGRRHWGQVHVHFASRCLAQACGERMSVSRVCVCVCVFACAYIIHTLAHTQTCTAHTHDYQNVRHLSFNLI